MKLTALFFSFCLFFISASAHQRKEDSDMSALTDNVKDHRDGKDAESIDQADRELSGYGYDNYRYSGEYDDGEDYGDYGDNDRYEYGYTRGYRNGNGGYRNGNGGYRNGNGDNDGYGNGGYRSSYRPSRTVYRHYGGKGGY